MSDLKVIKKYLIELLGKTQNVNGTDIEDERVNLFLYMISDDRDFIEKYILHGINKWDNTQEKGNLFGRVPETHIDPEIDLFVNDVADRVVKMNKDILISNYNKLVNQPKLPYNANMIIDALFKSVNGNTVDLLNRIAATKIEIYDEAEIRDRLYHLIDPRNVITVINYTKNNQRKFIDVYHARRPLAFSFELDEYLLRRMLHDASTANIPTGSSFLNDLDSSLAVPTHEYYRKPEDLSKLWTKEKDASGKEVEVEVQRESQKEIAVTKDPKNCRGTFVNSDAKTCSKYLQKCLTGDDIKECKEFMTNKKFWGNADGSAKVEVKEMLPSLALETLTKFGFRQVNVFDSVAKRNIFKVETVSSWLENLSKTITDTSEYNAIKSNENLIKYLTLLEVKINASPEILNKGITSSDGTQPFNPNKFAGQFASQVGIRAKLPNTFSSSNAKHVNTLINYGVFGSHPVMVPFRIMRGGDGMVGGDVSDYVSNMLIDDNKDSKFVAFEYENMYNSYKNALKGMNKTIDPVDDKELQKLITSFKNTEKKAFVSLRLIKKYIELIDIFKYNDPRGVLTLSNLDLLVSTNKSQLDKGTKKQESLTNALNTLASVVENAVNVVKPTSAGPGSFTGSSFSREN